MPAATLQEVFDFEGNLEEAFVSYLAAEGLTVKSNADLSNLDDDYISIQFAIGGLVDEHMTQNPLTGNLEYDHYSFSLTIIVHSDRSANTAASTGFARHHREKVALVRQALSISKSYSDGGIHNFLSYYSINRLMPSGTDYDSTETQYEETSITYSGDFSILTTAWPVS